jgi:hypothetical protein
MSRIVIVLLLSAEWTSGTGDSPLGVLQRIDQVPKEHSLDCNEDPAPSPSVCRTVWFSLSGAVRNGP